MLPNMVQLKSEEEYSFLHIIKKPIMLDAIKGFLQKK